VHLSIVSCRASESQNRSGNRVHHLPALLLPTSEIRGNSKLRNGYKTEYIECFNINIKCSFQDDTRVTYKINLIFQRKISWRFDLHVFWLFIIYLDDVTSRW